MLKKKLKIIFSEQIRMLHVGPWVSKEPFETDLINSLTCLMEGFY